MMAIANRVTKLVVVSRPPIIPGGATGRDIPIGNINAPFGNVVRKRVAESAILLVRESSL